MQPSIKTKFYHLPIPDFQVSDLEHVSKQLESLGFFFMGLFLLFSGRRSSSEEHLAPSR